MARKQKFISKENQRQHSLVKKQIRNRVKEEKLTKKKDIEDIEELARAAKDIEDKDVEVKDQEEKDTASEDTSKISNLVDDLKREADIPKEVKK